MKVLVLPIHRSNARSTRYCLSYTALVVTLLPLELVAVVVTVRVLPLAETTMRPLRDTLPSFLPVNANVWLFIFLYDRMSEVGSPVTGESLPSNLPVHSLWIAF